MMRAKSIQATFLLHRIKRPGCLWACAGIWFANALNPVIWEPWALEPGIVLQETGPKTGLTGDCTTLDFWKIASILSYTHMLCLRYQNLTWHFSCIQLKDH